MVYQTKKEAAEKLSADVEEFLHLHDATLAFTGNQMDFVAQQNKVLVFAEELKRTNLEFQTFVDWED